MQRVQWILVKRIGTDVASILVCLFFSCDFPMSLELLTLYVIAFVCMDILLINLVEAGL